MVEILGLIGVKSRWNRYLQAYTNGDLHCSNEHRNEEETWFLVEVDRSQHIYALRNWRSGFYLTKTTDPRGCADASNTAIGRQQQWYLQRSDPFEVQGAVLFRSVFDTTVLGAYPPGHNDDGGCPGEVTSSGLWPASEIPHTSDFAGFWVLEGATEPTAGKDLCTAIGAGLEAFASKITPADVAAVAALLV